MRKKITVKQSLIPFLVRSSQAEKFQRCTELLPLHSPKPLINMIEEFDCDSSSWCDRGTCPDLRRRESRTWQHSGLRSLMLAEGRRFVENLALVTRVGETLLHNYQLRTPFIENCK